MRWIMMLSEIISHIYVTRHPTNIELLLFYVNPSGKASTKIPQLPLGDNSSPWGDNAICT
jgi:hypothetical protein